MLTLSPTQSDTRNTAADHMTLPKGSYADVIRGPARRPSRSSGAGTRSDSYAHLQESKFLDGLALKITEDLPGDQRATVQTKLIESLTQDINRYLTGGTTQPISKPAAGT